MKYMRVSEDRRGTLFGGPYNKDPTIEGTILGSTIFGTPHIKSSTLNSLDPKSDTVDDINPTEPIKKKWSINPHSLGSLR